MTTVDPILDIRVIGTPRPQGNHVPFIAPNGQARLREKRGTSTDWRSTVAGAAYKAIGGDDAGNVGAGYPYEGPVTLVVRLDLLAPKKPKYPLPATRNTGDVEKHIRAINDALQDARVIKDDAAVVDLCVSKRYTTGTAGARITVYPGGTDFLGEPVTPAAPPAPAPAPDRPPDLFDKPPTDWWAGITPAKPPSTQE